MYNSAIKKMAKKTIIILGLAILILIIGFAILNPEKERVPEGISFEEKGLIDVWVLENNLNQYGDSKDTVYIGGTPLFNEMTGESIDKYEYIVIKYQDRPWLKK